MGANPTYGIGLDAGNDKTRLVVLALDDLQVHYVAHAEARSAGWSKGRLSDPKACSHAIRKIVREVESSTGISIGTATLGVGGPSIQGSDCAGIYEFGQQRKVTPEDVTYAMRRASQVRLEDDRFLLHVFPQHFTLDGRTGRRNPVDAICSRLEANVHIVTMSARDHESVVQAMHLAHLAAEESVFGPVAAAYACLWQEERSRGVALLSIGAGSSDLVVYDGEAVVLTGSLPISAEHFTRDVAWGLSVSYEDAVSIKEDYGCAIRGLTSGHSYIEVPTGPGRTPRETTVQRLNEILEARAEELFEYFRDTLVNSGVDLAWLGSIYLTGGGAMLNGMREMADYVLNRRTDHGCPFGIKGWPQSLNTPAWTTAAGLAMYSCRLKLRGDERKSSPGFLGLFWR